MRFIDLFAGLGGFHVALEQLGHECVFASEKDASLRNLYQQNYGIECQGDIRRIEVEDIPKHDILCAGFPCQPFSKAGKQLGLGDVGRGDLIFDILRILAHHRPQYFILENVPNLRKHEKEQTWQFVEESLRALGYDVKESILSPHQFGVPQIRRRIFIVGSLGENSLADYEFPRPLANVATDVRTILDENPAEAKRLTDRQIECLNLWQEIIQAIPKDAKLPSFPIWAMEYKATYPLDGVTPFRMTSKDLGRYKGAFGQSLKGLSKEDQLKALPSYAIYDEARFPDWKIAFIKSIRQFLADNEEYVGNKILALQQFSPSWQKLEWNISDGRRDIFQYLLQFRASGIRVKRTEFTPALVLTSTQIPIIGWEQRYITIREASRLQQLDNIELPNVMTQAYRALGNAVNVRTVYHIAQSLLPEVASQPAIEPIFNVA